MPRVRRLRSFASLVAMVTGASCATTSAELVAAKGTAYSGSFEAVWGKVVETLATEFPIVLALDPEHHRILTCWHSVDRRLDGVSAGDINADRLFYRAAVQLSAEAPWRITVSGRAAHFTMPQIIPYKHGDASEPAWIDGRTERLTLAIHKALTPAPGPVAGSAPPEYDPGEVENIASSCVVGDTVGLPLQHMSGFRVAKPEK
jgi:hypothetical protein